MTALFSAMNANTVRTDNGMRTLATSESKLVDLFYEIGASRGQFKKMIPTLAGALATDTEVAVRILLWARDVRGGAGERQLFRDSIEYMAENPVLTIEEAVRLLNCIPELGRWDDVFSFVNTGLEDAALIFYAKAIESGDGLAAKWAPRKGPVANKLRKAMDLSPKEYRRKIVDLTNVVETAMCAKEWETINFSHVPSVAAARLQAAFTKHDAVRYASYRDELAKPQAERAKGVKINATAVYPYDIVRSLKRGDKGVADAQWNALPNYMEGSDAGGVMPLVDVSYSMKSIVPGTTDTSCLDVAISLGMYISERNDGLFKDTFMTFSASPEMVKLTGNLSARYAQLRSATWSMNTDLNKAFDVMLTSAIKNHVPASQMPSTILVLSDMQFDTDSPYRAYSYGARYDRTAQEMIEGKYRAAGYAVPNLVYWNLNSSSGTPVAHNKYGTALVSGFSPSIMKSLLSGTSYTPYDMMMETVGNNRYDW